MPLGREEEGGVAHLYHEVLDDSVEGAALEVQGRARGRSLLARAEGHEVNRCPGHRVRVEHHHQSAYGAAPYRDVEEHLRGEKAMSARQ